MDGLLKGSCDSCTSSKVKCSGGNPCNRCKNKGLTCSYRPKRKRGPQKNSGKNGKRRCAEGEEFAFVSSYEKRIWSVFFTMFKNQNRNRADAPYAWCWFAGQLEKLKEHLSAEKNVNALKRLEAWLDALDVDLKKIVNSLEVKCSFPPHQCGSCSAIAMSAPNPSGKPLSNAKENNAGPHGIQGFDIDLNDQPRLLLRLAPEGSEVKVNSKFEEDFGLGHADLTGLLNWSGGGFLPWGGDVLAKLIVRESDLLVFLQILAIKFQALGPPTHDDKSTEVVRGFPSTHMFELWTAGNKVCRYLVHCLHTENIVGKRITNVIQLRLESLGAPFDPSADTEKQVTLGEDEVPKAIKTEVVAPPPPPSASAAGVSSELAPLIPTESNLDISFDVIPEQYQSYYDSWDVFGDQYARGAYPPPPPVDEAVQNHHYAQQEPPSQLETAKSFDLVSLEGDGESASAEDPEADWLGSLLEWSGQPSASNQF